MTMVYLGAMLAVLLGPCAALYACLGLKAERTLPFSVCAQALFLYGSGLFLPFSWGVYALCATALACWAAFLFKTRSLRRIAGFFSVPCLAVVALTPIVYYACCNRLYLSYDEYSHWGLIVKLISVFDELPRAGAGAAYVLYDYPPMSALWPSLACALREYREGIAYFGYSVMLLALCAGFVPSGAKAGVQALSLVLTALCLAVIFPFAALRLFSEPMIALLFVLLAFDEGDAKHPHFAAVRACVLAACLALTKNSALLFVLMACAVRAAGFGGKEGLRRQVFPALSALAAFASYSVYRGIHGIASAYQPESRVGAWLSGTLEPVFASVPQRFAEAFLTRPFPQSGVYSCYAVGVSAAVLFAALLALCAAAWCMSEDRRRDGRRLLALVLGQMGFILVTMMTYMLFFTQREAQVLGEFDRYMSLPALIIGLSVGMLFIRHMRLGKKQAAAAAVLAAALIPLAHPQLMIDTYLTRSTVHNTLWGRDPTTPYVHFVRAHVPKGARVFVMGASEKIAVRYELAGDAFAVSQAAPFNAQGAQEQMQASQCDYVLATGNGQGDDALDSRYDALMPQGEHIAPGTLYRVQYGGDGSAQLIREAQLP